jgi:hypothetical protein
MVWQTPLLAAMPQGVLDMTADFAPLFVGLVVAMGLCIVALAFTLGVHDTREATRTAKQGIVPEPSFRKAA